MDEAEGVYSGSLGFIQLDGARVQDTSEPPFSFMICPLLGDRLFFVKAASEADRRRWRELIDRSIKDGAEAVGATYRDRLASLMPTKSNPSSQESPTTSPMPMGPRTDFRVATPAPPPSPSAAIDMNLHSAIEPAPLDQATERLRKYLSDATPPSKYDAPPQASPKHDSPSDDALKLDASSRSGRGRARAGGTFSGNSRRSSMGIPDDARRSAELFDLSPTTDISGNVPFADFPIEPRSSHSKLAHSRNSEPDLVVERALSPAEMSIFNVEDNRRTSRNCCTCQIL